MYSTIESGTPVENMGIAVGISLIAALEPEISWEGVILSPSVTKNGCKKSLRQRVKARLLLSPHFSEMLARKGNYLMPPDVVLHA